MNKEISTKNFVMILKDDSRFFLDASEAEMVKAELKKGTSWIEIGENMISCYEIRRIIGGGEMQEAERYKFGDYKCKGCGQWIPRGKTCGRCPGF